MAAVFALAAPAASIGAAGAEPPCAALALAAVFRVVPNSAGAGNISYDLQIRNRTTRACFVSGLPVLRLLGREGKQLPTHVFAATPGRLTAVRVLLRPGGYAAARARFSPDVPGPGEPVVSPCERKAYRFRLTVPPVGGTLLGTIAPPTAVCEHGGLAFSAFIAGLHGQNP
jgi:hypothetical protein